MIFIKYLGLMVVFLTSCSLSAQDKSDQFMLADNSIDISNLYKQCVINIEGVSYSLNLIPPCFVLRGSGSGLQAYEYKDIGVEKIFVIVGNKITNDMQKEWGIGASRMCGSKVQGVMIKGNSILISEKTLSGGVICEGQSIDEKVFWYLSH